MKKKTIAIDMDGVLADVESQLINHYNKAYGTSLTKESIQGLSEEEAFKDRKLMFDVLNKDVDTETEIILASTDDVRDLRKLSAARKTVAQPSIYHKVQVGQNLGEIADKYKVEVQDLKVWNALKSNTIIPGQKLKVAGKFASAKTPQVQQKFISYKVKPGDTLSGIAEKFDGATVASIKATNGLKKATLQPGMVLKIKS